MIPVLQNRWVLQKNSLYYYGLRKVPYVLKHKIRLSAATAKVIASFDGKTQLTPSLYTRQIKKLIQLKIIVDQSEFRHSPNNWEQATFCKSCCANDYMIPGIEFNEEGVCPICATKQKYANLKNVLPVIHTIPHSNAKYDCAVFYTGGKDSSFLLWHLSKVKKLRVLALTWHIPYLSDNALQSIENAKKLLPDVDFIIQKAPEQQLNKIYRKIYTLQSNICICPSVAYVLFFETLCKFRVPFLILGNEPAQCKNLIYNQLAPDFYFRPFVQNAARLFINISRIFTLRKPYRAGQMELYMTVKNLAFEKSRILKWLNYQNPLIDNTRKALAEAAELMAPFRKAVKKAGRWGFLPALVHVDFDGISNSGSYEWAPVKQLLTKEIGWVDAEQTDKGLHTSCKIERCKEYSQFAAFTNMSSAIIPFSAIELSIAVSNGSVSREAAINELIKHSGFQPIPPVEQECMMKGFNQKPEVL